MKKMLKTAVLLAGLYAGIVGNGVRESYANYSENVGNNSSVEYIEKEKCSSLKNKLEKLAEDSDLVYDVSYDNPSRDKKVFYDWVVEYGKSQDFPIEVKTTTPVDDYKMYFSMMKDALRGRYENFSDNFLMFGNSFLGTLLEAPLYPLVGGQPAIRNSYSGTTIAKPIWSGVEELMGDGTIHEMMHAYQLVMIKDLAKRGLVDIDSEFKMSFHPGEPPTITYFAPTKEDLNKVEKETIERIIEFQERN